jgi:excisionase family DNA binding protein
LKKLLTTKELAELLKVTTVTIWRWRDNGLPFIKIGRSIRFDFDEVMKWIRANKN